MTTLTTEETGTPQATGVKKPKPGKKARVGAKRAHVPPKKAKAVRNAKALKKVSKAAKKAEATRDGSKAAKVLDLVKRAEGATLAELMKATGWQAHSVRGFLSTAGKKHRLKIESTRTGAGERTYKMVAVSYWP